MITRLYRRIKGRLKMLKELLAACLADANRLQAELAAAKAAKAQAEADRATALADLAQAVEDAKAVHAALNPIPLDPSANG